MSDSRLPLPTEFEPLKDYLVEKLEPLRNALTIQVVVARNILDYTVLRTEETRELNTTATPLSVTKPEPTLRVVFLGGKQKAPETRTLGAILRTANKTLERKDAPICYLKDKLCMHCPRCALFGAVSTRRGTQELNLRHRIEYSSAYSLLPYEEIEESITFNAIDEVTTRVGQALGETPTVAPANIFPSIVAFNTVTWKEFLLALKTILGTRSYGGETRTRGDVVNVILGIAAGWEEIISPLELTLELYDRFDENQPINEEEIVEILKFYQKKAAFINKVKVLSKEEVYKVLDMVQKYDFTKEFLDEVYRDVDEFLAKASSLEKGQTETPVATRRKSR